MAAPGVPYGMFLQSLLTGDYDYASDTFKVMLTTASYIPDVDNHAHINDVTHEVVGTGYTAGGAALTGLSPSYDASNHWFVLNAPNVMWSAATVSFRYAVVYKATGVSGTSILVGYLDFGTTQNVTGSDFGIAFPQGVIRVKPTAS